MVIFDDKRFGKVEFQELSFLLPIPFAILNKTLIKSLGHEFHEFDFNEVLNGCPYETL